VEKPLRKKYRLQLELSDLFNINALVSLGDSRETLDILVQALTEIAEANSVKNVVRYFIPVPAIPEAVVSPRNAYYGETKVISLDEAEGQISTEMIMAYPPGIPIICPGERVTREIIDYVNVLRNEQAILQGTEDPEVKQIKVLTKHLVVLPSKESLMENVI